MKKPKKEHSKDEISTNKGKFFFKWKPQTIKIITQKTGLSNQGNLFQIQFISSLYNIPQFFQILDHYDLKICLNMEMFLPT